MGSTKDTEELDFEDIEPDEKDLVDDLDEDLTGTSHLDKKELDEIAKKASVSTNTLQSFLTDVNKYPLLTFKEEQKIARRVQEGDLEAKKIMVQSNLRLVIAIAKGYRKQEVPFLDLIQDGTIGLMKAADKFDPSRGYKFSTYATWWIRQAISRGVADKARVIRMPVHIVEKFNKIIKTERELYNELSRDPTHAEISEVLDIPVEEVSRIVTAAQTPASLDRPINEANDEDNEFMAYLVDKDSPSTEESVMTNAQNEILQEVLSSLSHREKSILELRYGIGDHGVKTLDEVGRYWNITKERVRQIENASLEKLKKMSAAQSLRDF